MPPMQGPKDADREAPAAEVAPASVFDPERRALTLGLLIAVFAFATEGMGVVPALPTAVRALFGLRWFGWVFSAFMLAWLIGTIFAGQLADRTRTAAADGARAALVRRRAASVRRCGRGAGRDAPRRSRLERAASGAGGRMSATRTTTWRPCWSSSSAPAGSTSPATSARASSGASGGAWTRSAATHLSDYTDYLEVHPDEYEQLFNTILINVTEFFRDPPAWEYLRETGVPVLLEDKPPTRAIRVWSAGCATGQEAYSLAMVLADALGEDAYRERVKIYATDIDEEALSAARQGVYGPQGDGVGPRRPARALLRARRARATPSARTCGAR